MIFDKNFLKMPGDDGFFIYQGEQDNSNFVNPYNDNPYMISSLQKLKKRMTCRKKQSIVNQCLDEYKDHMVENPQLNHVCRICQILLSKSAERPGEYPETH